MCVLWLLSVAAALSASNIDVVVRLLGSLAAAFIFILPGVCLLHRGNTVQDNGATLWRVLWLRCASLFYIGIGVFTFGLSVTLAVQGALLPSGDQTPPLCVVGSNATSSYLSHHHFSTLDWREHN